MTGIYHRDRATVMNTTSSPRMYFTELDNGHTGIDKLPPVTPWRAPKKLGPSRNGLVVNLMARNHPPCMNRIPENSVIDWDGTCRTRFPHPPDNAIDSYDGGKHASAIIRISTIHITVKRSPWRRCAIDSSKNDIDFAQFE